MDFKNKVILITGASSGIGKETAIEFAKLGANIVLVARRKDKLEQVANELKDFPNIGLIKYGNVFFIHTAPRTIDGTMISSLEEFAALKIAFATVLELSDVDEYFGIFSNEG